MKKLMIALASATVLLASSAMAQEKLKIGAAPYGLNAEFMQIWSAALEQHPAVKSGEVELTVFDGRYDALVQQEQFNTMITQKFNAIIFVPIDIEAGATAVQAAHDAGIPVVGSNTRVIFSPPMSAPTTRSRATWKPRPCSTRSAARAMS